jgi:hypothetical protein
MLEKVSGNPALVAFRREARRVQISLSENCNNLPLSLTLQGVSLLEDNVISGGGFADIFRGSYRNEVVALKRLRIFQPNEERQRVHKVSSTSKGVILWLS